MDGILRTNLLAVCALMTEGSSNYGFLRIANNGNRPRWADLFTPLTPDTGLGINLLRP